MFSDIGWKCFQVVYDHMVSSLKGAENDISVIIYSPSCCFQTCLHFFVLLKKVGIQTDLVPIDFYSIVTQKKVFYRMLEFHCTDKKYSIMEINGN